MFIIFFGFNKWKAPSNVPLRFIAETLGIKGEWDQETETIELIEDMKVLINEYQEEIEEMISELQNTDDKDEDA
ncbi:hypothetical protein Amet_4414 [Alkaliphilus metalliredigens QYMF]|uniref:Copper amine oxidase-like N-terminal domain-containing protein n=1 Tax=Alkaliphilus metalliredigens (strain QYMF) TaxID=293826 RepID=A6TWB8_ALKMQ|nr:stalk domain-containing protein [Alkaliphilus metalliredigens]ABR50486.1 hypothetical protein Amet_4414 [Alkaliphilus metalliredigens QYMF]